MRKRELFDDQSDRPLSRRNTADIDIERGRAAGHDDRAGERRRQSELICLLDDASWTLSLHERLGDDTTDARGAILSGDRGVHGNLPFQVDGAGAAGTGPTCKCEATLTSPRSSTPILVVF